MAFVVNGDELALLTHDAVSELRYPDAGEGTRRGHLERRSIKLIFARWMAA